MSEITDLEQEGGQKFWKIIASMKFGKVSVTTAAHEIKGRGCLIREVSFLDDLLCATAAPMTFVPGTTLIKSDKHDGYNIINVAYDPRSELFETDLHKAGWKREIITEKEYEEFKKWVAEQNKPEGD